MVKAFNKGPQCRDEMKLEVKYFSLTFGIRSVPQKPATKHQQNTESKKEKPMNIKKVFNENEKGKRTEKQANL